MRLFLLRWRLARRVRSSSRRAVRGLSALGWNEAGEDETGNDEAARNLRAHITRRDMNAKKGPDTDVPGPFFMCNPHVAPAIRRV